MLYFIGGVQERHITGWAGVWKSGSLYVTVNMSKALSDPLCYFLFIIIIVFSNAQYLILLSTECNGGTSRTQASCEGDLGFNSRSIQTNAIHNLYLSLLSLALTNNRIGQGLVSLMPV